MYRQTDVPTFPIDLPPECGDLVIAESWSPDYSAGPGWWNRPKVHLTPSPEYRWSYGDVQPATRQTASHVLIRYAGFSDYSGSDVEASNHRSLLRDFPDTFVELYGDFGTQGLLLPVSCLDEAVLEAIAGLAEYPLYDEEDSSALVMEWTNEAIRDYLRQDMANDLDRADRTGEANALRETSDEDLTGIVWEFYSDRGEYPYAESVGSVVFPDSDALTEHVVTTILDRWAASLAKPADGQTTLSTR
jgi:hypothetical protein